jgi:hypothetical protein
MRFGNKYSLKVSAGNRLPGGAFLFSGLELLERRGYGQAQQNKD